MLFSNFIEPFKGT